jgi:AraC-like DNA-binding protein
MQLSTPADVRAWMPPVPGVREVLHASFADHAYPPHTHDVWTLCIVDDGSIRYDLDRRQGGGDRSSVNVLPPHVVHDGRTATSAGYRKRCVYLEPSVIGEEFIGAAVDHSEIRDPELRAEIAALHDALECVDDAFEAEVMLGVIAERIARTLGAADRPTPEAPRADVAEALRAYLDSHAFEPVTLSAAADAIGARPTQAARAFADTYAIAPHTYLVGRRLEAARGRILAGEPLADVAAAVGFFDQAHLTHRFRRFLGITPGRFAAGAGRA